MLKNITGMELEERVRWYIKIRWYFVIVLALSGILPTIVTSGFSDLLKINLLIADVAMVGNFVFFLITRKKWQNLTAYRLLAGAQIALDVVLATSLVYTNGGIESRTMILYAIPIIMSSAFLGRMSIYITGLVSTFCYQAILILDFAGLIEPLRQNNPNLHDNREYFLLTLFFYGAVLMTITAITDFVARLVKQREQLTEEMIELNAEKAKTESIVESMGSALVAINRAGMVTLVNTTFERLTGWSRAEVIGKSLEQIVPILDESGKSVPPDEHPMMALMSEEPSTRPKVRSLHQFSYRRKDGSSFPFTAHLAPIIVNNRVVGVTSVFQDATAVNHVEELKNNFIAMASHELKTPVSEIAGYIDNMLYGLTGKLTAKQTEYLKNVQRVAMGANKMVTTLLDMSIFQHNTPAFDFVPVKVSKIFKRIAENYEGRLQLKKAHLEIDQTDPGLNVSGDPDILTEAIGNVVASAINYSQRDNILLQARSSGNKVEIKVGFTTTLASLPTFLSIVEKSERMSGSAQSDAGTDMGLYLAKQLIELHGGSISVDLIKERDVTFTIKLPAKGGRKIMDQQVGQTGVKNKTVLIIEDELPFRQIYRDILRTDGYEVVEAENGMEALKLIEESPPDLILLDIIMPEMSGFDVLTKLKNDSRFKNIPVIVYSILNRQEEIDKAMKLGASDFTIKGETPALEVLTKIKTLLEKS